MFKVGDFVRCPIKSNNVYRIKEFDGEKFRFGGDYYWMREIDIELWQPKEGEWCWFKTTTNTFPFIARYGEFNTEKYFVDNSTFIEKHHIKIIEPFTGELPSFIKE